MLCKKTVDSYYSYSGSTLFSIVNVLFHTVFKRIYTCILYKHSEGFAKIFLHYLYFNMGQVKLSVDKYILAICLSLGNYQLLLFPHPCCKHE